MNELHFAQPIYVKEIERINTAATICLQFEQICVLHFILQTILSKFCSSQKVFISSSLFFFSLFSYYVQFMKFLDLIMLDIFSTIIVYVAILKSDFGCMHYALTSSDILWIIFNITTFYCFTYRRALSHGNLFLYFKIFNYAFFVHIITTCLQAQYLFLCTLWDYVK